VRLVRNHESNLDTGAFAHETAYDPAAGGGTTTLEFDTEQGRLVRAWASISGTLRNCCGGPTPWGSWLTCEETIAEPSAKTKLERRHGYIFEVPSGMNEPVRPVALVDMGRFVHEAVAVDPATGIVYETEDFSTAGFYRFLPRRRGQLQAGGTLQMLAIDGRPRFDTRANQEPRATYRVTWVDIKEPERAHADARAMDSLGVFTQGLEQGGAIFARLEGVCHGEGRIYFTATSGGNARAGQVWELDPASAALRLVFESPSADVLDMPDNACMSPRGGIVLCEDGRDVQFVRGLTRDGRIFDFARNSVVLAGEKNGFQGDFSRSEFAGATFSPDGRWLFLNVQTPGITFAVTGPWEKGGF
jgi:secreted PhoX family phosphatase